MPGARWWRSIRATSARWTPSRSCSPARRAGRSASTCSRSARLVLDEPQARVETLLQAAAIWEEKVEDLDARRARSTSGCARRIRPTRRASERLEAIYRAQYKWVPARPRSCSSPGRAGRRRRASRSTSSDRWPRSTRRSWTTRSRRSCVLQAAFREDYAHERTAHELERLADGDHKWEELLDEYTQLVQSSRARRPRLGRGPVGEDRPLVRRAPVPRRVRDPLGGAALRIDPNHVGALGGPGRAPAQARRRGRELIETLRSTRRWRPTRRPRSSSTCRWPICS